MKAFLSAIVIAAVIAGGAGYYLKNFVDERVTTAFSTTGVRL